MAAMSLTSVPHMNDVGEVANVPCPLHTISSLLITHSLSLRVSLPSCIYITQSHLSFIEKKNLR
jgi:hypothetical protein